MWPCPARARRRAPAAARESACPWPLKAVAASGSYGGLDNTAGHPQPDCQGGREALRGVIRFALGRGRRIVASIVISAGSSAGASGCGAARAHARRSRRTVGDDSTAEAIGCSSASRSIRRSRSVRSAVTSRRISEPLIGNRDTAADNRCSASSCHSLVARAGCSSFHAATSSTVASATADARSARPHRRRLPAASAQRAVAAAPRRFRSRRPARRPAGDRSRVRRHRRCPTAADRTAGRRDQLR